MALSEQLGDVSDLVPALFGMWRSYVVARSVDETNNVALQLRRIAEQKQETELHVVANYTSGFTALCMGKPGRARACLEKSIALYLPTRDSSNIYRAAQDPGVAYRGYLAIAEWLLGYPDRAWSLSQESIALAEELDDRFSLAYALCYIGATVSEVCAADTDTSVERGLEIATKDGYNLWVVYGSAHRANVRFEKLGSDKALTELRESIDAITDIGAYLNTPYLMTVLAKA